jgi:MYXO-CTERM domain-containing protein
MMRLVNRARTHPDGENQLHGTSYAESPVPPLAYWPQIGRAAQNHNEWMSANRNNPVIVNPNLSPEVPDSFSHNETLDGTPGGPTGQGSTSGWSGQTLAERANFTGYSWGALAENIAWRSDTPTIDATRIEENHLGWWNSMGHRENIMSPLFTVFGHHVMNDTQGITRNHWATQNLARPFSMPYTHIFGLLYADRDATGDWTPRDASDPLREGLGAIAFDVVRAGGGPVVASGTTFDNGGYSANVANGVYEIVFTDPSLPAGRHTISGISVTGANIDAGDTRIVDTLTAPLRAGDANQDLRFDQLDLVMVLAANKYLTGQAATWGQGDWNGAPGGRVGSPPLGDRLFNQRDIVAALAAGTYLTGPYAADAPPLQSADHRMPGGIGVGTLTSSFGPLVVSAPDLAALPESTGANDLASVGSLTATGSLLGADLVYVPVPEPPSGLLAAAALGVFLVVRRRRTGAFSRSLSR